MPTATPLPYRVSSQPHPFFKDVELTSFQDGLRRLYARLPETALQCDRHDSDYVRLVLETALSKRLQPKAEPDPKEAVPAKDFAAYFLERNPGYSTTKAGLSALLFESWLAMYGGELFGLFLETVLTSDTEYLAIFTGPISDLDLQRISDKVEEFASFEVAVKAGDRDYTRGLISDVTMLSCKAAAGANTNAVKELEPQRASPQTGIAQKIEGLLPQTRSAYQRVVDEGGLTSNLVPLVFGADPFDDARFIGPRLVIVDPNGVEWSHTDESSTWLPDVQTFREQETPRRPKQRIREEHAPVREVAPPALPTIERMCEESESGALRSHYGSWAVFSAPIEGGPAGTVVLARDRAWTVRESLEDVVDAIVRIESMYEGLAPEFDLMAEAFLTEYAEERGEEVSNPTDLRVVVESCVDTIEERDEQVQERARARRPANPDAYRAQVGRCPDGYFYDEKTHRCVRKGQMATSGAVKSTAATAVPPTTAAPAQAQHGGSRTKELIGHAVGAITHPFHAALDLIKKPEARKALKDKMMTAVKKEGRETGALVKTIGKALRGEKITSTERNAAISQVADVAKVAALTFVAGHMFAGGVAKALITLASPVDEIAGIALDKPLRAITTKLFGAAHGLLPTAFYESAKTVDDVLGALFDAIIDELSDVKVSDADLAAAIEQASSKTEAFAPKKPNPFAKDDPASDAAPSGDTEDPNTPSSLNQPPPPPEPEATNDHMDEPPFYREDLQGYYDLQITTGVTTVDALARVRQKFKVKGLIVTPAGEVRAPGVIDRPKTGSAPPPPPPSVAAPLPPPIAPQIATGGPVTAQPPADAEPVPNPANGAPAPQEAAQAPAGPVLAESVPPDQQLDLPSVDDAFMFWLVYEDGDLDDFPAWLEQHCPKLADGLEVWQPANSPLSEGRLQRLEEARARRTKTKASPRGKRELTVEQRERYDRWRSLVNVPAPKLRRFLVSETFRNALSGPHAKTQDLRLARDAARRTFVMKATPVEEWTGDLWNWCGRQLHFISRLRGSPAPLIEQGRVTRKYLTLKAWGHDPGLRGSLSESAVLIRQRVTTCQDWICPHCKETIGEKALFYGRKDEAGEFQSSEHASGTWFHRACKGQLELPESKADAISATNRLIDSLAGTGPRRISEDGEDGPEFDALKRNRIALEQEERDLVLRCEAVWQPGPKGAKTPAVWKAKIDEAVWYVTNTHRAFVARPTLGAAIRAYHETIRATA